jgi:hypothetical protein
MQLNARLAQGKTFLLNSCGLLVACQQATVDSYFHHRLTTLTRVTLLTSETFVVDSNCTLFLLYLPQIRSLAEKVENL